MSDPYDVKVRMRERWVFWTDDGELVTFRYVGRKMSCSICGREGYPPWNRETVTAGWSKHWAAKCRRGHPVSCRICRRRFVSLGGLSAHAHPRRPGAWSLYAPFERRRDRSGTRVGAVSRAPGGNTS